jgi:hypothetical protein
MGCPVWLESRIRAHTDGTRFEPISTPPFEGGVKMASLTSQQFERGRGTRGGEVRKVRWERGALGERCSESERCSEIEVQ